MKDTFASRVRQAAKTLQDKNGKVTYGALHEACATESRKQKDQVYGAVRDLIRRGALKRRGDGSFCYEGKPAGTQKQEIMWRYLRSSRSLGGVTIDELMEVAKASAIYAREWLDALAARGVVKRVKDRWQLLCDPVEMPQNDAKAERWRALQAKKRAKVLDALATAKVAISQAEKFILEES